jgi:hypothetical protein
MVHLFQPLRGQLLDPRQQPADVARHQRGPIHPQSRAILQHQGLWCQHRPGDEAFRSPRRRPQGPRSVQCGPARGTAEEARALILRADGSAFARFSLCTASRHAASVPVIPSTWASSAAMEFAATSRCAAANETCYSSHSSSCSIATIHHQLGPGHESGLVRGEIDHRPGNVVGFAHMADRMERPRC